MSAQQNKDLIKRYLSELSGHPKTRELIDKYVSDPKLREHIESFEAAFPGYELNIDDIVAEGDLVAIRATFRGTQSHDFMSVSATGKQASVVGMVFYRVEGERIVDSWILADSMSLMEQLGASLTPA